MPVVQPKSPTWLQRKLGRDWLQRLVTMLPLLLVNAVAVGGQLAWAHDHLSSWHLPGQVMFAMALESVSLFIAFHAYLADKANDSALKLKVASYAMGLCVGIVNYSHFAPDWKPTAIAVVTGGMSASSPWLWATYSRRVSRNTLAFNGLVETHSLRLGATRWLWHPARSFQVMRLSTWNGQTHVGKAIDAYNKTVAERESQEASQSLDNELRELTP